MDDVAVGIIAIIVGALFCFRGWQLIRLLLPLIGAFAGFILGARIVAAARGEELLDSPLAWVVAIAAAIVLGLLAYFIYAIAVVVGLATIGFSLASAALIALGVTWSWVVVGGAVAVAVVVAIVAIVGDVPRILLVVLTALAGANAMVAGAILAIGQLDLADFTPEAATDLIRDGWWWYVAFGVLALLGIVAQAGSGRGEAAPRDSWSAPDSA